MASEHPHQLPRLDGLTALVTGAGGPVGRELGAALADRGARVVGVDLPGSEPPAWCTGEHRWLTGDVTDDEDWARIVGGLDRVDLLVNNAARYGQLGRKTGLLDLTNDDWDEVLRVNVRAVWQAVRWVADLMPPGSSIVNLGSVVSRTGVPGFAHYVASKAAVEGFTRAAARELGGRGIRVNTVSPGLIDNDSSRLLNSRTNFDLATTGRALGRPLASGDLVGPVLWLASGAAGQVTGQCLVVDGGGTFT